jgi:hypothetical protein
LNLVGLSGVVLTLVMAGSACSSVYCIRNLELLEHAHHEAEFSGLMGGDTDSSTGGGGGGASHARGEFELRGAFDDDGDEEEIELEDSI